jgi:alkaline phosphatase
VNRLINAIFLVSIFANFCYAQNNSDKDIGYKADVFWSANNKQAHLLFNRAISRESHIAWGTGNHTASPVPCGAIGPEKYIQKLKGVIDNTDIGKVTKQAINDGVNVILMIGDGMGFNHMSLPIYMKRAEGDSTKTNFEKIMNEGASGIVFTNPIGGLVTCSASAATAFATGSKTIIDVVGIDSSGYPLQSSLELAEKLGYKTGLVTDAGITDGTPAGFYAHIYNRDLENDIAAQLLNHNIDVIFGGAAAKFIPKGKKLKDNQYYKNSPFINEANSDRDDEEDLFSEFEKRGYKIISNKDDVVNLNNNAEKVLGLFAGGGLSAAIDRDDENTGEPSLIDLTKKSLDLLCRENKNFFVMIEAGRIDWEAHDNDAGAVYKAVEEMDKMLGICYAFQKAHSNTLLIFTADHETGGLGISYTKVSQNDLFKKELKNGNKWQSDTDPLFFKEFKKLKNQKRSLYKILSEAKSVELLKELLNKNIDYQINLTDAENIYNMIHDYSKAK